MILKSGHPAGGSANHRRATPTAGPRPPQGPPGAAPPAASLVPGPCAGARGGRHTDPVPPASVNPEEAQAARPHWGPAWRFPRTHGKRQSGSGHVCQCRATLSFCKQVMSPPPGLTPIIRLNTQRARVVTKTRGVFRGGARAGRQGHPALRGTRCAGHRLLAGRPPGRWLSFRQVDLEPAPPSARLAGGLAARETRV